MKSQKNAQDQQIWPMILEISMVPPAHVQPQKAKQTCSILHSLHVGWMNTLDWVCVCVCCNKYVWCLLGVYVSQHINVFFIFPMIPIPQITPQMQSVPFFLCLVWFLRRKGYGEYHRWNDRMTEWQNDRMTEWQNERMKEWKNERMKESQFNPGWTG